jgi:hypothetical protein
MVRQAIADVSTERSNSDCEQRPPRWIPALSHLAGHLLDAISEVVWHQASTNDSTSTATTPLFEMQSWSHLLWAWSPAGRANEGLVIRSMIAQQEAKLRVSSENDLSNVL